MKPALFTIARDRPGRLSTMAKPRGGDWLEDEMSQLAREEAKVIVCLLTPQEMQELELEAEPEAAASCGIDFIALPTTDRGLPDRQALQEVLPGLVRRLERGEHVVAHCRYGIGRSSVLAAAVLVAEGVAPDDAWQRISDARGRPVPDTDEQRMFVAAAQRLR